MLDLSLKAGFDPQYKKILSQMSNADGSHLGKVLKDVGGKTVGPRCIGSTTDLCIHCKDWHNCILIFCDLLTKDKKKLEKKVEDATQKLKKLEKSNILHRLHVLTPPIKTGTILKRRHMLETWGYMQSGIGSISRPSMGWILGWIVNGLVKCKVVM